MKKVGLFFGSFNPVHQGHLIIANYMVHYTELDEVWLVVSPHNPLKKKNTLANMYDRLEMVNLALEDSDYLKSSTIEFDLPQPSYTIDTLTYLQEKYPNVSFSLIMGSDNLVNFHKWKNYELILRDYRLSVYPRFGFLGHPLEQHSAVTMTDTPLMELSSTFIRQSIKTKKSVKYFLPDSVVKFIESKGLYE